MDCEFAPAAEEPTAAVEAAAADVKLVDRRDESDELIRLIHQFESSANRQRRLNTGCGCDGGSGCANVVLGESGPPFIAVGLAGAGSVMALRTGGACGTPVVDGAGEGAEPVPVAVPEPLLAVAVGRVVAVTV